MPKLWDGSFFIKYTIFVVITITVLVEQQGRSYHIKIRRHQTDIYLPDIFPIFSLFGFIWLDAPNVVRSALHQSFHQFVGLCLLLCKKLKKIISNVT